MKSKKLWFGNPSLEELERIIPNTLSQSLNIKVTEIGDDYLKGTMTVDGRTKQPFGLLHGGASVALAEELGSLASFLTIDSNVFTVLGLEINANHVKAVRGGSVTGICKPIHVKGVNHIWEIKIYNDAGDLTCISRFTCVIFSKAKFISML